MDRRFGLEEDNAVESLYMSMGLVFQPYVLRHL